MKPAEYSGMHRRRALAACLLLVSTLACGYDESSPGWTPQTFIEAAPWQEQEGEMPAYPEQDRLLEVPVSTGGQPYRLYVDPASLTMGEDRVARYSVVIVSSSGVWNVSYEGLHCGEQAYRRYAYGLDGHWQVLDDSPWLPITGSGMNRYRKTFYNVYMCNPTESYPTARQVLVKLRAGNTFLNE
jgi:hypothetical protein